MLGETGLPLCCCPLCLAACCKRQLAATLARHVLADDVKLQIDIGGLDFIPLHRRNAQLPRKGWVWLTASEWDWLWWKGCQEALQVALMLWLAFGIGDFNGPMRMVAPNKPE